MIPTAEWAFWVAGTAAAVFALATPVIQLLRRLGKIETALAVLHTDVAWIKHVLKWGKEPSETTTHS